MTRIFMIILFLNLPNDVISIISIVRLIKRLKRTKIDTNNRVVNNNKYSLVEFHVLRCINSVIGHWSKAKPIKHIYSIGKKKKEKENKAHHTRIFLTVLSLDLSIDVISK